MPLSPAIFLSYFSAHLSTECSTKWTAYVTSNIITFLSANKFPIQEPHVLSNFSTISTTFLSAIFSTILTTDFKAFFSTITEAFMLPYDPAHWMSNATTLRFTNFATVNPANITTFVLPVIEAKRTTYSRTVFSTFIGSFPTADIPPFGSTILTTDFKAFFSTITEAFMLPYDPAHWMSNATTLRFTNFATVNPANITTFVLPVIEAKRTTHSRTVFSTFIGSFTLSIRTTNISAFHPPFITSNYNPCGSSYGTSVFSTICKAIDALFSAIRAPYGTAIYSTFLQAIISTVKLPQWPAVQFSHWSTEHATNHATVNSANFLTFDATIRLSYKSTIITAKFAAVRFPFAVTNDATNRASVDSTDITTFERTLNSTYQQALGTTELYTDFPTFCFPEFSA